MAPLQPSTNQKLSPPFKRLKPNPLPSTSYNTLQREHNFRHPSSSRPHYPQAHELIKPHIESFNALFGDGQEDGLLQLGISDLDEKVMFDGKVEEGKPWGNRLSSQLDSTLVDGENAGANAELSNSAC